MALNNVGMGIVITAQNLAGNVINSLASQLVGFGKTGTNVADDVAARFAAGTNVIKAGLKQVAIGLGIATAGFVLFKQAFDLAEPAGKFEQGLSAIGAITNATTEQMMALEEAAIQAGVATQFSPQQAVEGLTSLATAGQTAEQSMKTLVPVLDLAAGSMGQLGVAGAAEAVVGTLNAFQFEANRATEVTDKLLKITQLTNFQARDFGVGLSKAAAAAAVFGQTLDDTLITVGLMRNANVDASSASTAFREATRKLGADTAAQNKLQAAGVTVFDKLTGKMRALPDIMLDLAEKTKDLTDKQKNEIVVRAFGARGLVAFNAVAKATAVVMREGREVTLRGADAIQELRRRMAEAGGTADSFRSKLLDTFEGQKTLLRGTLETIAIAIGKPFAKVLKPVVQGVVETLNTLLQVFLALPEGIKKFFAGGTVVLSLTLAIAGLTVAVVALIPVIKTAFALFGATVAAAAIPLLKVIVVVGAIIAAVVLMKKAFDANFGGIRDVVLPVIERISLAIRALFALMSAGRIEGDLAQQLIGDPKALAFVEGLSRAFAIVQAIAEGVFTAISAAFGEVSDAIQPVLSELMAAFSDTFAVLQQTFEPIAELLGFAAPGASGIEIIRTIARIMTKFFLQPLVNVIKAVSLVIRVFTFLFRAVMFVVGAVRQLAKGIGLAVGGVILSAIEKVVSVWKGFKSVLNDVLDFLMARFAPVITVFRVAWTALATTIQSVWTRIATFVGGVLSKVKGVFVSVFNEIATAINFLISQAQKVAFALAPTTAKANEAVASLEKVKIGQFGEGGGAVTPGVTTAPAGVTEPTERIGGVGVTGAATEGTRVSLPAAAPIEARGEALTREDIANLVEAAIKAGIASERGRPIIVQGEVMMDGTTVGEMQAQDARDRRARLGRQSAGIGGR